ncbi:hypothetical protein Tsubulata_007536 [Turnera subulata]|uniref:Uncharacterized protein n=1 Tax=Turnera subulata TaxID=218843 RepID=A0A9Q0IZC4_9ROSI|nr:hypothetical protein Tsubulata_007536 [Turnera subulata]
MKKASTTNITYNTSYLNRIWGDRFLSSPKSTEMDNYLEKQVQELKEEVKKKMIAAAGNDSQILNLIDLIQRLGMAYHFDSEIDEAFGEELLKSNLDKPGNDDDLYMVALRFRLLRQQGVFVSCDVFNKFKDQKGHFNEDLNTKDACTILSLYEASHFRVHSEQILEEALVFTTKHLESIVSELSPPLSVGIDQLVLSDDAVDDELVELEILEVLNDKKQNFNVRKKIEACIEEKSLEVYDLFDVSTAKEDKRRYSAKRKKKKRRDEEISSLSIQVFPEITAQLKSVPRVQARHFFSIYEADASHDKVLLAFAKLDFNRLQKLHQVELSVVSRWWKELDFATKLPFTRDRLVECFVWILSVYFEPQYSLGRKMLVKTLILSSNVDDIYDAYGTPEELQLLTDTIKRWDFSCMDKLPEYMKHWYKALLDTYEEMEKELTKQGRSYLIQYSKEEMKNLAQYYFDETKWLHKKYIPTLDEYLSISVPSSGYLMLAVTSYLGMGNLAPKEALDWAISDPKIIRASAVICRIMDDIAGHEFEQQRAQAPSSVECCMNQYGVPD